MWNGVNYLLKMTSDLDFLDDSRVVRQWLGFSVFRNPFVVPLPLEQLPVIKGGNIGNQYEEKGPHRGPDLASFLTPDFTNLNKAAGQMELPIR